MTELRTILRNTRVKSLLCAIVCADSGGGTPGSGDVVGPSGATDDNIVVFDGTTGKLIKGGGYTIAQLIALGYTTVVLSGDDINNNASANTLQNVGNLNFAGVSGGIYHFIFFGVFDSAATGNGSRWTVNCASVTNIAYISTWGNAVTNPQRNTCNAVQLPASTTAASAYTNGNFFDVEGVITFSANDTLYLQSASEGSGVAITAKGSRCFCLYRRIA